jgi:hypothetical protein
MELTSITEVLKLNTKRNFIKLTKNQKRDSWLLALLIAGAVGLNVVIRGISIKEIHVLNVNINVSDIKMDNNSPNRRE